MKTTIKRRPFGNNGFEVSEVSFGAMNLRMLKDLDLARKLINDILDQGINCIDTARAYNSEAGSVPMIESEVLLGEVISQREDIDEPLLIITKGHGYSPEEFRTHLNESLTRLQVRNEDGQLFIGKTKIRLLYLLHGIKMDRWDAIESSGVLDVAEQMRQDGVFTMLGFSSHYGDSDVIHKAITSGRFQGCELPYNVYNPSLGEEAPVDFFKLANEYGMGIINMKAYNGSGTVAIFKQLRDLTNIDYPDMTRFCLSNPYVSTIDAGVRSLAEFLSNAGAADQPLMTQEERAALRDRALRVSPYLNSICRECMHCLEKFSCPSGVDFPKLLGIHGRYLVCKSLGFDTAEYQDAYRETLADTACIECGQCVPWCEYHLDIPQMLKIANSDFGV